MIRTAQTTSDTLTTDPELALIDTTAIPQWQTDVLEIVNRPDPLDDDNEDDEEEDDDEDEDDEDDEEDDDDDEDDE